MSQNIKISILLPVHNGALTLEKSIISVLEQTHKNLELVIINDASRDTTPEILKKYSKIDRRIKVINNCDRKGITKSLNIGINHATGEYIARQDADDYSSPKRLSLQLQKCNETGFDVCFGTACIVDIENNKKHKSEFVYDKDIFLNYLKKFKNPFVHGTLLIKSKLIREYFYNEKYLYFQDFELWNRLLENNKFCFVKNTIYFCIKHNNSISYRRINVSFNNFIGQQINYLSIAVKVFKYHKIIPFGYFKFFLYKVVQFTKYKIN